MSSESGKLLTRRLRELNLKSNTILLSQVEIDYYKNGKANGSVKFVTFYLLKTLVRPVPNVVLLPCRTQMKLPFQFKHGSSTPFVTIRLGTAELGSARLLSTAGLAVPHGSSTAWFQTACYCRAELNS